MTPEPNPGDALPVSGMANGGIGGAMGDLPAPPPIPDHKLLIKKVTAEDRDKLKPLADIAEGFAGHAPLWAYILSEAQVSYWDKVERGASPDSTAMKLGPVGGRIVADVFAALLRGDPTSYLNQGATFTPIPCFAPNGKFGLAELINAALDRTP